MANSYKLLDANPNLVLKDSVYQNTETFFRDSTLDNRTQIAVQTVFESVHDKSLFSYEIEQQLQTDLLRSALSTQQHQYLRALDFNKVHTALDLTQDFGGVSHFLAGKVSSLDSVKLDVNSARLARSRCANHSNILQVVEDPDRLNYPQSHYDLIVIGEAEALTEIDLHALVHKLRDSLSPDGVLLLNVANRNRLNRWFDGKPAAGDDNIVPFNELYRPSTKGLHLSRDDLRQLLLAGGYANNQIHSIFSQGKDCKALFSEDYLTSNPQAINHFHRLGFISNPQVNEYLLFHGMLAGKRNFNDTAGRFLAFAGPNKQAIEQLYDNDFTHLPGKSRRPQWRTITSRRRSAQVVCKTPIAPQANSNLNTSGSESIKLSQNLADQGFQKGPLLVHDWLMAVVDLDDGRFKACVSEYWDWLSAQAQRDDFSTFAYDALPFNVIVKQQGKQRSFEQIDPEWQIQGAISAEFVLFRALFWFAHENRSVIKPYFKQFDFYSIGLFIVAHMPTVARVDDLAPFVALEEQLQDSIVENSLPRTVANALVQGLNATHPVLEVSWANADGQIPRVLSANAVWEKSQQAQTLVIPITMPSEKFNQLRVDPMTDFGALEISCIELKDNNGDSIWSASSIEEVKNKSVLVGMLAVDELFYCVGNDPYLLIDLSDLESNFKYDRSAEGTAEKELEKSRKEVLELHLTLCNKESRNLDATISILSQEALKQTAALQKQTEHNNQYRAEIAYLNQRIGDLKQHRTELEKIVKGLRPRVAAKQKQINNLVARLNTQYKLNENLYQHLTTRPLTRIKGVLRRIKHKVLRRPAVELPSASEFLLQTPKPEDFTVPQLVRHFPLPKGDLLGQNNEDYGQWVRENCLCAKDIELAKNEIDAMVHKPVFSILVPIYNTDPEYLLPMIESVKAQIYPHWELCLVDDCSPKSYLKQILTHEALQDDRIKVQLNEVNQGISVTTNDALAIATGDYIALLDHDDEISIDALYENAKVINEFPDVGLIYSDEDKIDMQGNRLEPFFKPDFSPDFLSTNNYICHFSIIKKSLADQIGGFREGLDGSQDHDIILRAAYNAERVVHIPKILYHWRKIPGSTAVVYDAKSYAWEAGRKAVEDQLRKNEGDGVRVEFGSLKGTYTVHREIRDEPLVSIIVPFKDKPELLDSCLGSIINRSSYTNIEIIGISNNSEDPVTHDRMRAWSEADPRVRFIEHNIDFNFSALCNFGASQATGDYLLLLNNDVEVIAVDWIEKLLEHAQRDEVGAVGGKLLYPNGRIQHAGIVVGMVGAAGHPHKFFPDDHIGYHGRLHMVHNVSAVTGAMLMVSASKFNEVNGLDEASLPIAYNDVDFCLKLIDKGYYNIFTPYASATHHESISRGYEDTDEKVQRLLKEQGVFLSRWQDFIADGDPYYNPNLSLKNEYFSLRFQD